MKSKQKEHTETHPLFPSGEWEGFYIYGAGQEQHRMEIILNFQNNTVQGGGTDDVGAFAWSGQYDTVAFRCQMTKSYITHIVEYDGRVDENGIWGTWMLDFGMKGGFHIWPKKNTQKNKKAEEQIAVKIKKQRLKKVGLRKKLMRSNQ